MDKMKIGLVGCGVISDIYMENLVRKYLHCDVAACADMIPEKAAATAEKYGIEAVSMTDMLASSDIGLILNLTIPKAHAEVAMAALEAGKHVYGEKPFSITRDDGLKMIALAKQKGLRIGSAPDTFLGGGIQTVRKLVDDGWIGTPVAATAFMMCHGHESWHPAPEFYYEVGGGPMFDMGPYYLTALVSLLGPVSHVMGSARVTYPQRIITSEPKKGKVIDVEVPTHVTGLLSFRDGATATIITSFDVWSSQLPRIEIYGSEGSLSVPDPNTFGGPVLLKRAGAAEWSEIPLSHGFGTNSRGVGVADMIRQIQTGGRTKADMTLAYHVLDVMHAIHDSEAEGRRVAIESTCERPEAMERMPKF